MSLQDVVDAASGSLLDPVDGVYGGEEVAGLPEAVRRYFDCSIAAGTPLARSVVLEMRGHIKLGRWLPFRAREILNPHRGFVWAARTAGVITGYDRYLDGAGAMEWKLGGVVTVMRAQGDDVTRSAAARAVAEMLWLPTAALPRFGVTWENADGGDVICRHRLNGVEMEIHYGLDADGRVRSTVLERWGDPDNTGQWTMHPFGGEVTAHATFEGLTIPVAGRIGWNYRTGRWPDGEFFRYRITSLSPT